MQGDRTVFLLDVLTLGKQSGGANGGGALFGGPYVLYVYICVFHSEGFSVTSSDDPSSRMTQWGLNVSLWGKAFSFCNYSVWPVCFTGVTTRRSFWASEGGLVGETGANETVVGFL